MVNVLTVVRGFRDQPIYQLLRGGAARKLATLIRSRPLVKIQLPQPNWDDAPQQCVRPGLGIALAPKRKLRGRLCSAARHPNFQQPEGGERPPGKQVRQPERRHLIHF